MVLVCSRACACAGCCRRGLDPCRCPSLLRCNALQRIDECLILVGISRVTFSERALGCDHADARFKAQMLYTQDIMFKTIYRAVMRAAVSHIGQARLGSVPCLKRFDNFSTISKRVTVSANSGYHETAHRQFQQMRLCFPATPFVYTP